jgi:hypothetical protein
MTASQERLCHVAAAVDALENGFHAESGRPGERVDWVKTKNRDYWRHGAELDGLPARRQRRSTASTAGSSTTDDLP